MADQGAIAADAPPSMLTIRNELLWQNDVGQSASWPPTGMRGYQETLAAGYITGVVTNSAVPVPNAVVRLHTVRRSGEFAEGALLRTTRTDVTGRYRFDNLYPQGKFLITVRDTTNTYNLGRLDNVTPSTA